MTTLSLGQIEARIDAGELISLKKDKHEYMHQKGSPGWRNTDTEMFPVIGPTENAGYSVETPRGEAILDQHGHLREMDYKKISENDTSALFRKVYKADTQIKNSKYEKYAESKSKSKVHPEFLSWPYDFEFEKAFRLTKEGLQIDFTIKSEKNMPFMLGYHPAFRLVLDKPVIKTENCTISLDDVLSVGSRALSVLNTNEIELQDRESLRLKTSGFKHFMLWTEVKNMVCIEPISFYPYAVSQKDLHTGFSKLKEDTAEFSVTISI